MVVMEVTVLPPSIGRVNLCDLVPNDGLPSDSYKISVSTLTESFAQYSAAIVKLPPGDAALVHSCLDSSRLYFHQLGYTQPEEPSNHPIDWSRTTGYSSDPQLLQETFDYRPGLTLTGTGSTTELSPCAMPEVFSILGKASRNILEAVSFSLNLQSSSINQILDNTPLRNNEISSSVLSVTCQSRPSFQVGQICPIDYEQQMDKTLITITKPDKAGLNVKDVNGFWVFVDENLDAQEVVVYAGLALYQLTAGSLGPAMYRTGLPAGSNLFGRCSVSFKLMAKSVPSLSCVDDSAQRNVKKSGVSMTVDNGQDAPFKNSTKKRRETSSSLKPLPPSKRLRLEAQRVLREKVMDIAEKKGIKLKFCSPKQCESHMLESGSSCLGMRAVLGWPPSVPFVHPHDLPNKAKIAFLEAFEPGWTTSQNEFLENGTP